MEKRSHDAIVGWKFPFVGWSVGHLSVGCLSVAPVVSVVSLRHISQKKTFGNFQIFSGRGGLLLQNNGEKSPFDTPFSLSVSILKEFF
jgi:hypothetical protein